LLVRGTLRPIVLAISPMLFSFIIRQQGNHGEGNGVSEKAAQPWLPIAYFFHGRNAYHVFAIAKT
jgi:hypothetical protein